MIKKYIDYLKNNPKTVKEYVKIKKEGVKYAQGDGVKYRKYKQKFIENILKTIYG